MPAIAFHDKIRRWRWSWYKSRWIPIVYIYIVDRNDTSQCCDIISSPPRLAQIITIGYWWERLNAIYWTDAMRRCDRLIIYDYIDRGIQFSYHWTHWKVEVHVFVLTQLFNKCVNTHQVSSFTEIVCCLNTIIIQDGSNMNFKWYLLGEFEKKHSASIY